MIKEVIENYVVLKKNGNNFLGICPFHADTKPSLFVNEKKNIFKCFACGVGGNAISFVQKYENCNFIEAKKKVNEILNKEIFTINDSFANDHNIYQKVIQLASLFLDSYSKDISGLDYLLSRKIEIKTCEKYKIGFFPNDNNLILDLIKNELGIKLDELVDLGLVKYNNQNEPIFTLNNRIVIPVYHNNNICGFVARTIDKENNLRYLNTLNLNKNVLYGLNKIKNDCETLFITEGVFDCLVLNQLGYDSVCTLGANFNIDQFKQLYNLENLKQICICFDNDKAGFINSLKLYKDLKQNFRHCSISFLDYYNINQKDINELLINDENKLRDLCDNTIDLNVFKLNELIKRKLDNTKTSNWNILESSIRINSSSFANIIIERLKENNFDELAYKLANDNEINKKDLIIKELQTKLLELEKENNELKQSNNNNCFNKIL